MFTGIIEEIGTVESLESAKAGSRIRIRCRVVLSDAVEGCSICVNGVCLTAVNLQPASFSADLAPETLRRSNLGDLRPGHSVNLERSLSAGGRLSGHFVQGHVDDTVEFLALDSLGADNYWLRVRVPPHLERLLVFKGSVALDGISLTVASIEAGVLSVTIVPHTFHNTNLESRRPADRLNIECDIVAKYVEKLLGRIQKPNALTLQQLEDLGY